MSTSANTIPDPRTIITPDAFSVSPDLVGTPLASPTRRFVALAVDLVFVALFSTLGWYLLGAAVVVGAYRAATRKSEGPSQVFRAFRIALGCFGTVVLVSLTLALGAFLLGRGDDVEIPDIPGVVIPTETPSGGEIGLSLNALLSGVSGFRDLQEAENEDEGVAALREILPGLVESGLSRSEIRELLSGVGPSDRDWWNGALERALDEHVGIADEVQVAGEEGTARPLTEALEEYASLLALGPEAMESEEAIALRGQIVRELARDTVRALQSALEDSEEEVDRVQSRLSSTQEALDEAENSGIFAAIKDFADATGLLFGWGTVYLTLFTTWWNGRTIGKRIFGIRVVRLDGKPMSGWLAFERAGGYAAGFATGLLGFAQIFWDPNRMAIHDKIAETAVIREGVPPLPGPWKVSTQTGPRV